MKSDKSYGLDLYQNLRLKPLVHSYETIGVKMIFFVKIFEISQMLTKWFYFIFSVYLFVLDSLSYIFDRMTYPDKIENYFLDERLDWFPVGFWDIMKDYFKRLINLKSLPI